MKRVDRAEAAESVAGPPRVDAHHHVWELSVRAAGVVGWAELTAPDLAGTLDRLRAVEGGAGLVGLRHQVQLEPPGAAEGDWLLRPDVAAGLDVLGDRGLVFDLIVTAAQLPSAIEAVRRHADTSFVLDHAGKPPIAARAIEPWATHIAELAALPNVAVKFSGLLTEAGDGQRDAEHLLPYARPLLETLDDADRAVVYGGTASRWYGLAVDSGAAA